MKPSIRITGEPALVCESCGSREAEDLHHLRKHPRTAIVRVTTIRAGEPVTASAFFTADLMEPHNDGRALAFAEVMAAKIALLFKRIVG